MRKLIVVIVSVLVLGAFALAQVEPKPLEVPKTELFIGYAYEHADTSGSSGVVTSTDVSSINLNGFSFEFAHYFRNSNLGFMVDVARISKSRVDSTGIKYVSTSYLAGPSYRFHKTGFFIANVHALAGVDHAEFTVPENNPTSLDFKNTDFSAAAGVGVDANLSRHVGIRVAQVDYVYSNHYNTNQGSFRYTGGVVLRF
jgi:hypothetical protein